MIRTESMAHATGDVSDPRRVPGDRSRPAGAWRIRIAERWTGLVPVLGAIAYPWLLDAFHAGIGPKDGVPASLSGALVALALALAVPLLAAACAGRKAGSVPMRRLAYAVVMAPTLYVFMGVLTYMVKARIPDETLWSALWIGLAALAWVSPQPLTPAGGGDATIARWRRVHGVTAAVITLYVVFHIFNHLFFLSTPETYDRVQDIGGALYHNRFVQPLLVGLLLMQTASGMRLFWRWSARRGDLFRTVQLATGMYLAVYIVGHMDSVFVFSRSYLGQPSDWAFATGAPAGILHDAWNIRLLPHYFFGVFCVLTHLTCGARGIALAHGLRQRLADRLWWGGVAVSAGVASLIMVGMVH